MGDHKGVTTMGPALESGDLVTPGQEVDPMAVGPGDPQGSKPTRGPVEDQEIAALWKLGAKKSGRDGPIRFGQEVSRILELGNGQGIETWTEGWGAGRWRERGLLLSRELETLGKGESMGGRHLDCEMGVGGWGVSVQGERINNNDSGEDSLLDFPQVTIQRTNGRPPDFSDDRRRGAARTAKVVPRVLASLRLYRRPIETETRDISPISRNRALHEATGRGDQA